MGILILVLLCFLHLLMTWITRSTQEPRSLRLLVPTTHSTKPINVDLQSPQRLTLYSTSTSDIVSPLPPPQIWPVTPPQISHLKRTDNKKSKNRLRHIRNAAVKSIKYFIKGIASSAPASWNAETARIPRVGLATGSENIIRYCSTRLNLSAGVRGKGDPGGQAESTRTVTERS
jgi:hypothetical protein